VYVIVRTSRPLISRSRKELDIIEHPHSCYVLGRSGTGYALLRRLVLDSLNSSLHSKTTTMLYKMLLIEASSESSSQEISKSRQLFVTQSPILAEKVSEHFSKLVRGHRPSIVSENVKAAKKADRALVHKDEESDRRSDLPKKYSDLQDTDFPLFVSFDQVNSITSNIPRLRGYSQLCTMIESDIEANSNLQGGAQKPTRLTYNKFQNEYWPHFPQSLCKGLGMFSSFPRAFDLSIHEDPSMVFSEFMGTSAKP
jgi:hypothetical protein